MRKKPTKKTARTLTRASRLSSVPQLVNAASGEILQSNQYKSLALRSMFWRPEYLDPSGSAWVEHLPFAFWIVEALQPEMFVELGTHNGHSYFSFCQAIKRLGLNTPSYAVDTWKGDEHAGHYDESVYQQVDAYNSAHYREFSSLLRCTFDEAVSRFSDGSIDLLHIDGYHTYEAVRHDFETWLPKLSDRAVVIFHDTTVRRDSFGVHKYFAELTSRYPHFEFIHGHGLGVLGVGSVQPEMISTLFKCYSHQPSRNIVYELFSRLGSSCHDGMDLNSERRNSFDQTGRAAEFERIANDRANHIAHLEQVAGERGAEIERLNGELTRLNDETSAKGSQVVHLEQVAGEGGAEIERLNGELTRLNDEIIAKGSQVAELEQMSAERVAEIERLNGEEARLHEERLRLEKFSVDQSSELNRLQSELSEKTESLAQYIQESAKMARMIVDVENEKDVKQADIERLNSELERLSEDAATNSAEKALVDQTAEEGIIEIERLKAEFDEKSEALERYIQESAQMARMILEAENEKERITQEATINWEESQKRASHILYLEQANREILIESQKRAEHIIELEKVQFGIQEESQKRANHIVYLEEVLNRYTQECAKAAEMIVEGKEERDAWKKISVSTVVQEVLRGPVHETGEYKQIDYTLREISHLGRKISQLDVRIVEHRGNPGILVFEPDTIERALYGWTKTGEETGRSYMLVIPNDEKGKDFLLKATTNDITLIKSIIIYAQYELLRNEVNLQFNWNEVATSLLDAIDSISERLHYDDIMVKGKNQEVLVASIINPSFRGEILKWDVLSIKNGKITEILSSGENKDNLLGSQNSTKTKIRNIYLKERKNIIYNINRKLIQK